MTPKELLSKAPKPYIDKQIALNYYPTTALTDLYGYKYLLKDNPTSIIGSVHLESELEENSFGRFSASGIIVSTEQTLICGNLIEWDNALFAIKETKSFNTQMGLNHYVCTSLFDYYADFLIDEEAQANQILGTNSMRYFLALNSDIPLLPSFFEIPTNTPKYISVNISSSRANALTYQNDDNLLQQYKTDSVVLLAVGLNTNELMSFEMLLQQQSNLGFTRPPTWSAEKRYNKEFDLKANLWRMELEVNYNILSNQELNAPHLIKKVLVNYQS